MSRLFISSLLLLTVIVPRSTVSALQSLPSPRPHPLHREISRRIALFAPAIAVVIAPRTTPAESNGIQLTTSPSGLRWADAKVGSGTALIPGNTASVDYVMSSTGGRNPKLYSSKDAGAPYRWILGDGSTIKGIELAILGEGKDTDGGEGRIPPMLPGGVRRVLVPSNLAYDKLAVSNAVCSVEGGIGPIPPKTDDLGAFQRFKQLYCNPRIPYQPDLILDIKLYGKRST